MFGRPTVTAVFSVLITGAAACGGGDSPSEPPSDPGAAATRLMVSEIGPQMAGKPFDVTVTLADAAGSPVAAAQASTIQLSVWTGTGRLSGPTSGTLAAGSSSVTFSAVAYDGAEAGVRLRATGQGGTAGGLVGTSGPFTLGFDFAEARVAFRRTRPGRQDIYLINGDGSAFVNVTDHPAADSDPAWSPDGTRIAFVSNRTGKSELHVMNVDGTGLMRLTDDPGSVRFPSWSPDGDMIAFSTTRSGQRDLFAISVPEAGAATASGGGALVANQIAGCRLTNDPATDNEPVWVRTPDGDWIFFFSTRDANDGVFRMEMDCDAGGVPTRITGELEWACNPGSGWSLQGRVRVSVVGRSGQQYDVYTMDLDGSNVTNVTNSPSTDFASSWTTDRFLMNGAPPSDEPRLIFDSDRDGSWNIHSILEDGSGSQQLTSGQADDEYPAARPQANGAAPAPAIYAAGQHVRAPSRVPTLASAAAAAVPVMLYDRGGDLTGRSCARDR